MKGHTTRYQKACESYSGSDYERAVYPDDLMYQFSFWQEIKPNPFNDNRVKFCADDYAEIYHSPQLQRIGRVIQLSQVDIVFPRAGYRRFEHSILTMYFARKFAEHLGLSSKERKLVEVYGLVHDIGHLPWGHCAENLVRGSGFDHEKNGMEICKQLKRHIERHVKLDDLLAMFTEENPLAQIISGTWGADRLAYLTRDIQVTNCIEKEPFYFFAADPEDIIKNTEFADSSGKPVLSMKESAIDLAANFLTLRTIAYNKIYHNPNVQILQRYAHKALDESGLAKPEILRNLYDEQLEEMLLTHTKMRIRMMVRNNLVLGQIPQTAAAILLASPYGARPRTQPADFEELIAYGHRAQAEPIEHPSFLPMEAAAAVEKSLQNRKRLLYLEQEIAERVNKHNPKEEWRLCADDIAIAVPNNIQKKKPEYAPIACGEGVKNLYEMRPALRNAMDQQLRDHWAIRIAVPDFIRESTARWLPGFVTPEWLMEANGEIHEPESNQSLRIYDDFMTRSGKRKITTLF